MEVEALAGPSCQRLYRPGTMGDLGHNLLESSGTFCQDSGERGVMSNLAFF